jgi:hypothetical protein
MFGLAALAAVAAMAFVGGSSAMANGPSSLCKTHEDPCAAGNRATGVHMVAVGDTVLKTNVATVLCLGSLASGNTENGGLGSPLGITMTAITWTSCGTTAAHNNCDVLTTKLGLFDALTTSLNLGTATALGTEVLVECDLAIDLHCVYGGTVTGFKVEGAGHTAGAGNGMFTATELSVPKTGGFFCPNTSLWTALYEPLEKLYEVRSPRHSQAA